MGIQDRRKESSLWWCFLPGLPNGSLWEFCFYRRIRYRSTECLDFFEEVLAESLGDECDGGSFGEAAASEEEELLRIGCAHGGRVAAADIVGFNFERGKRKGFDIG